MSPSPRAPTNRAAVTRARQYLSKAARRAIRRAAALADELNFYSFRVHDDGTISWTLWHQGTQVAREAQPLEAEPTARTEPSARATRSRTRAAEHAVLMDKARDFCVKSILSFWSRAATSEAPAQQPPPMLPPGLQRPHRLQH